MLWAALIVTAFEQSVALQIFRRVAKVTEGKFQPKQPVDVGHSGLSKLPIDLASKIIDAICSAPGSREVLRPLLLLDALPLREEWAKAIQDAPVVEDWNTLRVAVAHVFDHQSQEATDCRWLRVLVMLVSGQLKLPSTEMIDDILYYPKHGDQQKVRPSIRATEIAFATRPGSQVDSWPATFWNQCWRDTPCIAGELQRDSVAGATETTLQQVDKVAEDLADHFIATTASTILDAKHEAIFGIANYGLAILREMLRIGASTSILARLGLRSLLEMWITLAYLQKKNSDALWLEYRAYGTGQTKLAFLKLDDTDAQEVGFVDADELNAIANEDRSVEFVPINLGHWDGTNLRKMSEQADVKPAYDSYYPWTSAYLHANWGAVRAVGFDLCLNALHRAHRILRSEATPQNDVLSDATELVDQLLGVVDSAYPGFASRVSIAPAKPEQPGT